MSDAMLTENITRPVEDPFRFLKEHHRKIENIFSSIEETTEQEVSTRERLFIQLDEELSFHTEIEEALIYPKLREIKETRDMIEQAYEEHTIVKDLLMELEMMSYDSEDWTAKMNVLMENVRHHVDEEESEVIPQAQSVLSEEDQEDIGREVEEFLSERNKA